MAGRYLALLWSDLIVSILLRIRKAPGTTEIDRRARRAAEDFLRIYAEPEKRTGRIYPKDRRKATACGMTCRAIAALARHIDGIGAGYCRFIATSFEIVDPMVRM
jgi:hypothetical protein